MTDVVRSGSIVVAGTAGGNLAISKSHTPEDRIVIDRADVVDLLRALAQAVPVETVVDSGLLDEMVKMGTETTSSMPPATSQLDNVRIVNDGKRLNVQCDIEGVVIAAFSLATEDWHTVESVHVRASGSTRRRMENADRYGAFGGIFMGGVAHLGVDALTWRTVGELATWLEGDGTDAQRIALADALRSGRARATK